jgi:hypothetical protein
LTFNFLINFNKTGDIQGNGQKLPDLCGDMEANKPISVVGWLLVDSFFSQFFHPMKAPTESGEWAQQASALFWPLPQFPHYSVSITEISNTLGAFLKGPAGLEVSVSP